MGDGMIYLIIGVLALGIIYLSVRFFFLKKTLRDANKQLREINRNLKENRIVKISVPNKELEELLKDINDSLHIIREERIVYENREKAFRQQIESISHDLRTPLTSMLGYLRIMETEEVSAEVREDLGTVIRKAERLQELINQFYDFSRVTDLEYYVKLEDFEVTKALREALAEAYGELATRQLEVTTDIPKSEVYVIANEKALQRVFQNLLQNAARYAKSKLSIAVREMKEEVILSFTNDVEGIDENEMEHLFERFYTIEASRSSGSTGLGLTIAKELVEKMKGSMEAKLEDGSLCIRMCFKKEE